LRHLRGAWVGGIIMTSKMCRLIAIVQCYSATPRDRPHSSEADRSYDQTGRG
jgi:hypothetical protein